MYCQTVYLPVLLYALQQLNHEVYIIPNTVTMYICANTLLLSMVVRVDKENYGSPIFTIIMTTLKWAFATLMHSYCSNDAVALLNAAKSLNIRSIYSKF